MHRCALLLLLLLLLLVVVVVVVVEVVVALDADCTFCLVERPLGVQHCSGLALQDESCI